MILSFSKGGLRPLLSWKNVLCVVVAAILLVGGFYVYRGWKEARDFVPQDFNDFLEVSRSDREIANYTKFMEMAYRADTYGGNTPEETLKLFTDALKGGDTELAAKYFVVEKQKQMAEKLAIAKQNDVLKLFIEDLTKDREGYKLGDNGFEFNTIDDRGNPEFSFQLQLNQFNKKWKIERL